MFVNFFLTIRRKSGCFNLVDLGQSLLSNHYNITTFNLRNLACDFKSGKFHTTAKALKYQAKDRYHMSLLGHRQAAFMIIQVVQIILGVNEISCLQLRKGTDNAV